MCRSTILISIIMLLGGLYVGCSDDYYEEEPVPGNVETSTIEQAFPDEVFMLGAETENEAHVIATFNPDFGQICMAYGIADTAAIGGRPDLTDTPVYSAQVFQDEDPDEGYYFHGKMFRWIEENEIWETFGIYEYHPNAATSTYVVKPYDLNEVEMEQSEFEVSDYLEVLNSCRFIGGDPTSSP